MIHNACATLFNTLFNAIATNSVGGSVSERVIGRPSINTHYVIYEL